MLDKLSKQILDYMANEKSKHNTQFFDFDEDMDKIASALNSDSESIRAAIRYLKDNDFIEYVYSNPGHHALSFYLDHNGLHYKEFAHLENRERWKERLWGFISGILSTLLITWLTGLLSI